MRERIKQNLKNMGLYFFNGRFPIAENLPDIDLAIISKNEKLALILELKWFIEPSEPREVLEKSEEISRGISQSKILARTYSQNPGLFFSLLGIDKSYELYFAVVSQNSVGDEHCQDTEIPVIREGHFVEKLKEVKSLKEIFMWLSKREYLPILNKHYAIKEFICSVGKWNLIWYGISPLIENYYR
jgi:hypothetical protein